MKAMFCVLNIHTVIELKRLAYETIPIINILLL